MTCPPPTTTTVSPAAHVAYRHKAELERPQAENQHLGNQHHLMQNQMDSLCIDLHNYPVYGRYMRTFLHADRSTSNKLCRIEEEEEEEEEEEGKEEKERLRRLVKMLEEKKGGEKLWYEQLQEELEQDVETKDGEIRGCKEQQAEVWAQQGVQDAPAGQSPLMQESEKLRRRLAEKDEHVKRLRRAHASRVSRARLRHTLKTAAQNSVKQVQAFEASGRQSSKEDDDVQKLSSALENSLRISSARDAGVQTENPYPEGERADSAVSMNGDQEEEAEAEDQMKGVQHSNWWRQ